MIQCHNIKGQTSILRSMTNKSRPSVISQCRRLYDVSGTHNVGLATQYRFNVEPASQSIAGLMPVNRIRRWPNIETKLGVCLVFALTAIRLRDTFSPGLLDNNPEQIRNKLQISAYVLETI